MGADSPTFEAWLRDVSLNPHSAPDEQGEVSDAWRRWLRRFFDGRGAAAPEIVAKAAEEHLLALAHEAVAAVLADMRRATPFRPTVLVDVYDHDIRITIDGGWHTGVLFEAERPAAFAEIADHFQEQLDEVCWPVCDQHDAGLHAEVRDDRAVWWCRVGAHAVARIGEFERSGTAP